MISIMRRGSVGSIFVPTRTLLSNIWFQSGVIQFGSKSYRPAVYRRLLKQFIGTSEEYTLRRNVPKTVPKVARTVHRFAGEKTFRVKGEEDVKGPDSSNTLTPENAPHIIHLMFEGTRMKDLHHDFDGASPTPTAEALRKRGIAWTKIYSQNFHTNSGYAPLYWGTFSQSHDADDKAMPPYAYLSHLQRAFNYSTDGVTNWAGGPLHEIGFQHFGDFPQARETRGDLAQEAVEGFTRRVLEKDGPVYYELRPEGTHNPYWAGDQAPLDIYEEYALFVKQFRDKAFQANKHLIWEQFVAVWVVDKFFGAFLKAVQGMKLRRKVLVVMSADHGYTAGEHEINAQSSYDVEFSIPFIIADLTDDKSRALLNPEDWNKTISDRLGANVDIFPTIFDVLGVREFETVGCGRSLRRVHPDPIQKNYSVFRHLTGHIIRFFNPNAEQVADTCDLSKAKFVKYLISPEPNFRLKVEAWNLDADPNEDKVCETSVAPLEQFNRALRKELEFYETARTVYLSGTLYF